MRTFKLKQVVRRKYDGALFEASMRDGYGEADALADIFSGKPTFCFRRIRRAPVRWWHRRARWIRTGEIWEPTGHDEFDVEKFRPHPARRA